MMNIMDMLSLKGKVAIMTGGAGLFGKQIVTALAQAGARTYIASRNVEKLEVVASQLRVEGHEVFALQVDQGDEKSIHALRDEILKREGKIDILVNNSVLRTMSGWDDDAERFAESMQVNATGVFMMTRAFGDEMAKAGKGSIVNIGSIQGMVGPDAMIYKNVGFHGFVPDYFFHKGGMINFTRFAASYYGSNNIRCNCISPAGLQTESHSELFVKNSSDRTFLGRMANNTDLMGIIVFLSSDASAYVTGTNIPVDGGYTAK